MFKVKKIVNQGCDVKRNKRAIAIAEKAIPLNYCKHYECEIAIFHKCMVGVLLVALNELGEPIQAWTNVTGFKPIKCSILNLEYHNFESFTIKETNIKFKNNPFNNKLLYLKPKLLYCNDTSFIDISIFTNIISYSEMQLSDILAKVKKPKMKSISNELLVEVPSFECMNFLQPGITHKEYEKFKKRYNQSTIK